MNERIAVFHMLPSGGGIRVAQQFASGLSEHFDLEIHRPNGGFPMSSSSKMKETVYPFPMWKKPAGILKATAPLFLILRLLSFKRICSTIAKHINDSADIALVHNAMPVAAPPVLNYLTIPSLYFCYEYPRHIYEKSIIRRSSSPIVNLALKPLEILEKRIDSESVNASGKIATLSSYMKKRIHKIYNKDSIVIPAGIDTNFFIPGKELSRENFVLSVGALWPFKGHDTAIRILSLIPQAERPVLRITADREFPGYGEHLYSLANELSVKLVISKEISDTELLHLYRNAEAVLCCQKQEPYGLVPLEAMACKTPVIAISEAGILDNIEDGKTGFLFNGTAEEGADKLAQVIGNGTLGKVKDVTDRAYTFVSKERNLQSGIQRLISVLEKL